MQSSITATAVLFVILLQAGASWSAEHRITTKGWVFHPTEITIKAGDKVTWFNDDDAMHNIFFEDESLGAPTAEKPFKIRVGKDFSQLFDKKGVYNYHCRNHRDQGMSGKVIVE